MILDGQKERQGDFVFTANEVGEYRFCFDNTVSTFTDKMVDLEITACPPTPRQPTLPPLTHSPCLAGRRRAPLLYPAKGRCLH